jgi:hypothetical protein
VQQSRRGGYGRALILCHPSDPDAEVRLACEVDRGIPRFTIMTHHDPADADAACMVHVKVARQATYVMPNRPPPVGLICRAGGETALGALSWSDIEDAAHFHRTAQLEVVGYRKPSLPSRLAAQRFRGLPNRSHRVQKRAHSRTIRRCPHNVVIVQRIDRRPTSRKWGATCRASTWRNR